MKRLFALLLLGTVAVSAIGQPPAMPVAAVPTVQQMAEDLAAMKKAHAEEVAALKAQLAAQAKPMPAGPGVVAPVAPPQNVVTAKLKDGREVKLGRIKPAFPRQDIPKFAKYLNRPASVAPPDVVDYAPKAMASISRMYKNDQLGCCVISGKMHQIGLWSGNDADSGGIVLATDNEVVSQYQGICGPGDNGCVITDVLDVMRTKGLTAGGKAYKIDGYVSVDSKNKLQLQTAIDLFGSVTFGIDLPSAWLNTDDGELWDVTSTRIVGGHDVPAVGYNTQGVVIATWAGRRTITWAALASNKWITETYAELAPLWYGNDKLAPSGVDVVALQADLATLGGGGVPPIGPATVTVPNVVGKSFVDAKGICALAGLSCNLAAGSDPAKPVTSQAPVAGVQAAAGSIVTATTSVVPPPPPPPPPGGAVTLTLTAEQVESVIEQSGKVVVSKETTIGQLLDKLNNQNGMVKIRGDMTVRELLNMLDKAKGPKPLAP